MPHVLQISDPWLLPADATAATLLQVQNALPRLLWLLSQSEEADHLAEQLDRALDMAVLPPNAALDEIRDIIALVDSIPPTLLAPNSKMNGF